jgi:hypothetical protein
VRKDFPWIPTISQLYPIHKKVRKNIELGGLKFTDSQQNAQCLSEYIRRG